MHQPLYSSLCPEHANVDSTETQESVRSAAASGGLVKGQLYVMALQLGF
jgi:hypothetical protein